MPVIIKINKNSSGRKVFPANNRCINSNTPHLVKQKGNIAKYLIAFTI